jgi:hypothetical protein
MTYFIKIYSIFVSVLLMCHQVDNKQRKRITANYDYQKWLLGVSWFCIRYKIYSVEIYVVL